MSSAVTDPSAPRRQICRAASLVATVTLGLFASASPAQALTWTAPQHLAGDGDEFTWGFEPYQRTADTVGLPGEGTFFAGASPKGIETARSSSTGAVLASGFAQDPGSAQRLPRSDLDLAVDGTGRVALATAGTDGVWLSLFAPGVNQPGSRRQLATPILGNQGFTYGKPAVALANDGQGIAAWVRPAARPAPDELRFSRLAPDGSTSQVALVPGAGIDVNPFSVRVATAANGVSVILWLQRDAGGPYQVAWTAVSAAGSVAPVRLSPNSLPTRNSTGDTQLVTATANTFFASATYRQTNSTPTVPPVIQLNHIADSGSVISSREVTTVTTARVSSDYLELPVLASNSRGEGLLAWEHWSQQSGACPTYLIYASRIAADASLGTPAAVSSPIDSGCSASPISAALADDGTGAIGWSEFEAGRTALPSFLTILSPTSTSGRRERLPALGASDSAAGTPFLVFSGPQTLTATWPVAPDGLTSMRRWQVIAVTDPTGAVAPPPQQDPAAGSTAPPVCTGAEAFCLPAPPVGVAPTQPTADPCKGVKGDLAAKLLASLQCSAAQTVREVQCGIAAAEWIAIPLKTLSFAKTAPGFYDVVKPGVPAKYQPLLRLYNKVLLTKFSKKAPKGFRTGAEVVEQLGNATTIFAVVKILTTAGTYVVGGSGDVSGLALDLLDVAGLRSCVEGLTAAVD